MKKNKFSVMHKIVALVLLGITVPPLVWDILFILGVGDGSGFVWIGPWISIPIYIVAIILGNAWGRLGGLILLACSLIPLSLFTSILIMAISSVAGLISLFSRK